jgi:hypothetical protein
MIPASRGRGKKEELRRFCSCFDPAEAGIMGFECLVQPLEGLVRVAIKSTASVAFEN